MAKPSWAGFFAQHHHPVLEQLFESGNGSADQLGSRFARLFAMASPPATSESVAGATPHELPAGALTHEIALSLTLTSPDSIGTAGDYLVSILDTAEINFVLDMDNQRLVPPNELTFLAEQMADILGPSAETLANAAPAAELANAAAILSAPDLPLDLTPVTIPGH